MKDRSPELHAGTHKAKTPPTSRQKLFIIDGSSYIFRAFYAVKALSTSKGFPTNAIFGFVNMLTRVLEVEKPELLAIAFDTPKPTFRKELYGEYKANRSKPPEDLIRQIPEIHRAVDCFGVWRLEREGFEADDVIATLAKQATESGYQVEIITGDKDLMQLVGPYVTLYDTMREKRTDEAGVVERFGVKPSQVVDFLALMGDSSDNIPGVSGIGEKTAAELIKEFDSLDGLYAGIERIKQPKRRETLIKERDAAYLSQKLAMVRYDVPIQFSWDELRYQGPRREALASLFQELEFLQMLKRFDLKPVVVEELPRAKYRTISDEGDLDRAIKQLRQSPCVSVDTETTSLVTHDARIVGVSLCGRAGEAYYIPVGHHAPGEPDTLLPGQLPESVVKSRLRPLLEDASTPKVGQNLKYDSQVLRGWGVHLKGIASDTLLASYLINPDHAHNLDSLALRYLNHKNISYEEVTGSGKSQISFAEVPLARATDYSAEDSDVALRLHEKLVPELEPLGMEMLYREIEIPLIEVLADMEYGGVLVDTDILKKMGTELERDLGHVQEKIYALAGEPLNINSPKQLSRILFEKLGLPVIRKTKTGNSTDEGVLEILAKEHDICRWIVKFRGLVKLKSTYVDGLLSQVHPSTLRIHSSYNQTVTATGRLSSSNPNLQNIPVGQEESEKYDIRSVFIAAPGSRLLSADYSQVELRILAHLSGDPELTRAFREGEDVHEYTGKLIFGSAKVSAEERRIAKTINFGVTYGQTPYGLSQLLGITPKQAKAFIDAYFGRYAGVQAFLGSIVESAREKGYVTTVMGRRRYLPEIQSRNKMQREMAERAAINAPIQGTAADMIKKAMVSLSRRLAREGAQARMMLQVHDELVLEVPAAEEKRVEAAVREEMESALSLNVPLRVDLGWGQNWSQCSE